MSDPVFCECGCQECRGCTGDYLEAADTLRAEVARLTRDNAAIVAGKIVQASAEVSHLRAVEKAARALAHFFPFPDHPREVAPSSPAQLRSEYMKLLVDLLDALATAPAHIDASTYEAWRKP